MAGNQRETKLTLRVEALGQEDLKALQDGLARLAKEGGDAAPEFQRLADEVSRLGDQAGTLAAFEKLAATTAELATKQQSAEQAAAQLKARLDEQRASVTAASTAQQEAATKYQEAKNELTDLGTRLKTLRAETDAAGKKTDEYRAAITSLIAKQGEQKKSLDDLSTARAKANRDLNDAERAEARLQASYDRSKTAIDRAADALQKSSGELATARAATEALGLSTTDVAASQAQLVAALNSTGAAAEALQADLASAAAAQRAMADASDQARVAADLAATEAVKAGQQIATAFGTVGIRGAQELEREIAQVRAAMDTLKNQAGLTGGALAAAMTAGNAKIAELERELRGATNALTSADRAANLFKNSLGQIAAGNLIADGVGAVVEKVKALGREFIVTTVETEQFRRGLNAIYKDTQITAQQFEFLRKTANDNGIAIGSVSQAFVRFSAATKSANIPIADTNALFASVTRTAGTLGLSAEAVGGTLDALGQIASKGVVSLEELRQQLGDRMPGALSAAAKGLGLTDAELIKLVESGNLAARDFFPAFTKGLQELQGETEGLIPLWNRLKNAFTIATQNAGDAGGLNVMTAALKVLAGVVGGVVGALNFFVETLGLTGKAIALLGPGLGSLTDRWKVYQEEVEASRQRQKAFTDAIAQTISPTQAAAAAATELTTATAAVSAAAANAGPQWDTMTRSQQASAIAAQIAATGQGDLGAKLVATNAAISTLLATQQKESEALGKLSKAAKEQGDTLVALAKIRGDEKAQLDAGVQAAELYATAQAKLSASQAEETRLLELQLAQLIQTRTAQGDSAEAIAKQTVELEKKIVTSRAEAEQSLASTAAAQQDLEVRRLSAATYGDQSLKAAEYKAEVERLTAVLGEYQVLNAQGRKTDEEVAAARTQLAIAAAKYKDALNDSVAALRLEAQEKTVGLQATLQAKNAEAELYAAKAQSSRNSGDLRMATYYETEAKRAKIEADRISIQIKEVEIKLEREELQLKLELLKVSEPENTLKQRELELRIKLTDIKTREIEASKELLRIKENESAASTRATSAVSSEAGARQANAGAISAESAALEASLSVRERDIALKEKEIELRDREAAVSRQGSASMSSDIATRTGILNFLKQAGVDDEAVAKQIANEFADADGNVQYSNNPGQLKYGGKYGTMSEALLKAAEKYTFRDAVVNPNSSSAADERRAKERAARTAQGGSQMTSGGGGGGTTVGSAPVSGSTRNITVNINGTKVGVTSEADADALERIFRDLESAAGRAI